MNSGKKVFVGVSGGVDSSVALTLLKEQGYDVTGVFIKVWYPDWITSGCDWRSERRDAMRVCAHLGVPFMTLDLESVYKKEVVDYMVESYKKGETPNPDIMCNRHVKFGAFWDFAKAKGADFVATGHYAQIVRHTDTQTLSLVPAKDTEKDQTYFLWTLTESDLEHILFPVGNLYKRDVRNIATTHALPTATKKDSQGLCFLGDVSIRDLLSHYIESNPGDVLNESGEVIGTHEGALYMTIGQRHGFTLKNKDTHSKPQYVIAKNMDMNTITVSPSKQIPYEIRELTLRHTHLTRIPQGGESIWCRIRYRGTLLPCRLNTSSVQQSVICETDISSEFPARGQSVVFYTQSVCLGGGVIDSF